MPNLNRRLPWQFVLLGFMLFIAALNAIFVLATAVGIVRMPGHERTELYRFVAWCSPAFLAVSASLILFGQRKRRRWRAPGAINSRANPQFALSRGTRVLIGLLLVLAAYLLWNNDLTRFLRWLTHDYIAPQLIQGILSIILIFTAFGVSVGGNYIEND